MRLDLATFNIRDVAFGDHTRLANGVLYIDKNKVTELIGEDPRFGGIDLHLVRLGDRTCLVNLLDVVEPRYKVCGPGNVFPGLLGPPTTVGQGRTNRLANIVVMSTSKPVEAETKFWRDSILDMSGLGAQYNHFSETLNLVLELKPKTVFDADERRMLELLNYNRGSQWVQEYHRSVRLAGIKVAAHLARATRGLSPDQVCSYEPIPVDPTLPRVVYSCQLHFHLVYGDFLGWTPTFVHPNEYMDGIITNLHNAQASTRDATYVHQNHPIIRDLYKRHGREINFLGVLLYRAQIRSQADKERSTEYAARLLRMMNVDGAVMTWTG